MSVRRGMTTAMLVVLLAAAWLLVAPQQLGGPIAIVSTYGDSMLPTYSASDLVVVSKASSYEIGDVVAYPSEVLGGAVVLHRIVDVDEDGYVTQGDNNGWLDADRPTDDVLMGSAQLRVPGAGRLLDVPVPVRAAAVTALAGLALFGGRKPARRRVRRPTAGLPSVSLLPAATRRHAGREPRPAPIGGSGRWFAWVGWPSTVALVGTTIGSVALLVAVAAFSHPLSGPGDVGYTHRGTFSYAADVPSGTVYPTGELASGDPIFLRLVEQLDVTYDYELDGPTATIKPSGQLWLEITDGSGWSNRSRLGEQRIEHGGTLSIHGALDLPQLRRTLERVRDQTGVGASTGTVTVVAEIDVVGAIAGEPVSDQVTSELVFALDDARLVPQDGGQGSQVPADDPTDDRLLDDADGTELFRTQAGSVTVPGAEPARLELQGRGIDVTTGRVGALAILAAALIALAVAAAAAWRRRNLDEAARIHLRYGRRFVAVAAVEIPAGYGIVDVRDITALISIADRADRPVLHHQSATTDTYIVEGDATLYRYRVEPADSARPPGPDGRSAAATRTECSANGLHSDVTRLRLRV